LVGASLVPSVPDVHVLMRFSGKLYDVGDVVAHHLHVIQREGRVWLGKLGARPGLRTAQQLNEQVAGGVETFLYLVQSARGSSEVFRCRILRVSFELPHEQNTLVPSYYDEKQLRGLVSFWFESDAIEQVDASELDRLIVMSSGHPARWSLRRSMSGFFVVRMA
jgi:hypothetical protein